MRDFFWIVAVVFCPVIIWRDMLRKNDIGRFSMKEALISLAISAVISAVLLFAVSK